MGYKCMEGTKSSASMFRTLEVTLMKKGSETDNAAVALTVQNDWDTLKFVKDNMDSIAGNLVKMRQINARHRVQVDENARMFENTLEPLFTLISATAQEHIMDKLSVSLKKALLLMAMDRYDCNSERICRALGISKTKLEKELRRCGLSHRASEAA